MPIDANKIVTEDDKKDRKRSNLIRDIAKIGIPLLLGLSGGSVYNQNEVTELKTTVGNLDFAVKIYSGQVQPGTPVETK